MPKLSILASFWKPEACSHTVLPDRSVLIGQKLVENAKIQMRRELLWPFLAVKIQRRTSSIFGAKIQMRHFRWFSHAVCENQPFSLGPPCKNLYFVFLKISKIFKLLFPMSTKLVGYTRVKDTRIETIVLLFWEQRILKSCLVNPRLLRLHHF